ALLGIQPGTVSQAGVYGDAYAVNQQITLQRLAVAECQSNFLFSFKACMLDMGAQMNVDATRLMDAEQVIAQDFGSIARHDAGGWINQLDSCAHGDQAGGQLQTNHASPYQQCMAARFDLGANAMGKSGRA